ncbi:MAG: glycosyltransferase [Oscillospiraceae bacterium]|nr:glycosyltransferase [Oscillospiraceae bacterium]
MTYKKFDRIYDTIQSVIDQDYPEMELIISDDGSEAFPGKEIAEYLEKNKKGNLKYQILTSENNQGTVRNINRAYRAASGKYIINLSADDTFCSPTVISRIVFEMESNGYELMATRRELISEKGEFLGYLPKDKNIKRIEKLDTPHLQHRAFITGEFFDMASGSAICIRNDTIKNMGYYDEKYVLWEDGPLFTRFTKQSRIATDYDILSTRYCLGGVSNSGTNPLMEKDIRLYNATDRCEDVDRFDRITQMKVRYIQERESADTGLKRIVLYLKNPLVMVLKICHKIKA